MLLRLSALQNTTRCFKTVVKCLGANLQDLAFGTQRNILHDLVGSAAQRTALWNLAGCNHRYAALLAALDGDGDELTMLRFALGCLSENQRSAVLQKDFPGRLPLHYAAEAGLADVCSLLETMDAWNIIRPFSTSSKTNFADMDGKTPLHLAVINGHEQAVKVLSASHELSRLSIDTDSVLGDSLASLLQISLLYSFTGIAQTLLGTRRVNVNYRELNGETALFIAARGGSAKHIQMLIDMSPIDGPNPSVAEPSYGFTPLIVACVYGQLEVVKKFLRLGADTNQKDIFGWTALDYVAFRGFWEISKLLPPSISSSSSRIPKVPLPKTNAHAPCPLDLTRIFVNLGSLNTRRPRKPVDLAPFLSRYPHNPYPEVGYSVQVKGVGVKGPEVTVELPVLDDATNYPLLFHTPDPRNAKLTFKILRQISKSPDHPIHVGTAIALLEELRDALGPGRESLYRDHTVPIIGCETPDIIGTLTLNFLLVKPFPDPREPYTQNTEPWSANGSTRLIGHRGLGMNSPAFKRLQVGENTIQSFKCTIDLGVPSVEVNVQLTRDHIPVIYHDFLLSESGADIAPHNLTLDQIGFMNISDMQRPVPPSQDIESGAYTYQSPTSLLRRHRSQSFDNSDDLRARDFLNRLKHTHEFKLKGFKGNVRGAHIHDPFVTLEELLLALPENAALDLEFKYPMLWEAEDWKMDLYGVEFNLYVDTILDLVYKHGKARPILFTTFSSEICILLSHKQQTYPVMLLNESNLFPTGDVRASNLQEAIHFARHWNLPGIVMSSEPFVSSPVLVWFVKDAGLLCLSFGMLNNDPESARIQATAGLDAIIVDDVALIKSTFRDSRASTDSAKMALENDESGTNKKA
ncbi:GDPD-domain-containing protein [Mytilinidion resinicola]|uniref:GDPD-domain-containing protein n=1 Tax=Mytilinidion resinicola TaxID=574789 RepID=A0A6A6YPJ3_9PEZI|nr:GDPD-domain-containing protein [Mytilinidion resinicola]KAF2810802.1 GDPD-domain-containing protein [Mytilinidion resinicola]